MWDLCCWDPGAEVMYVVLNGMGNMRLGGVRGLTFAGR